MLQDLEPIRSILIAGERVCAEVYALAMPDGDSEVRDLDTLGDASCSACFLFRRKGQYVEKWVDTTIFDAFLTLLLVNPV